jgi:hypothetical protein
MRDMIVNASWSGSKEPVTRTLKPKVVPRSDTRNILAEVYGDAITGLVVTLTVVKVLPEDIKVPVWTKVSGGVGAEIILTELTPDTMYKAVIPIINKTDTTPFMPGDTFEFDIQFETDGTNEVGQRKTIFGNFTITEDYTLN